MADTKKTAAKQLREITECPICMNVFTDPRMLPCIHTFCLECLKRITETAQKGPGDKLPCSLCRKEFLIPAIGMDGVPKNFFLENLLQYKMTLQMGSTSIICDLCSVSDESKTGHVSTATWNCLECQDNYCDACFKIHHFLKVSRDHNLVKIGSNEETSRIKVVQSVKYCSEHTQKPLEYYCAECKKIVCVHCFVEKHKSHDCKAITTVDTDFRKTIEISAHKISNYADEVVAMRKCIEKRKVDFLKEIVEKEEAIHKRNQELKEMIDRDTKLLLDELSSVKLDQLKTMEDELEITDRSFTILKGFDTYCTELVSKGTASDICSSYDELVLRADGLEKDHEEFIGRPHKSVEVTFKATDLRDVLQEFDNNIVGIIQDFISQFENCAIAAVFYDDAVTLSHDLIKINLQRPNEISTSNEKMPIGFNFETVVSVYCNTMYISGLGNNRNEVWKNDMASGWEKCAYLAQGRSNHCAAFIDEVLYICGGFVDSNKSVLDSVEAFNAVTNKCITAGKLVHCVQNFGNCVPFRTSLYIFGGTDKEGKASDSVQVFSTIENTCSVLSSPMPEPSKLMQAALWETSVILLGYETCFIFNLETETWQRRNQFKTDVFFFGLVLENERVFVIGGGNIEKNKDDSSIWECRDDVRYVPIQNILDDKPIEWKFHAKLPKPSLLFSIANMPFFV